MRHIFVDLNGVIVLNQFFLKGQYCQELERSRMISVSPLVVEDVEVVTLELEEASAKVVPALEQVEDEEEDDIVEVGRVIIIIFL